MKFPDDDLQLIQKIYDDALVATVKINEATGKVEGVKADEIAVLEEQRERLIDHYNNQSKRSLPWSDPDFQESLKDVRKSKAKIEESIVAIDKMIEDLKLSIVSDVLDGLCTGTKDCEVRLKPRRGVVLTSREKRRLSGITTNQTQPPHERD